VIELTDVYGRGVMLRRVYGVCELWLYHFAYNGGDGVCLYRGSEGGMEESFGYWAQELVVGRVPRQLVGVDRVYERCWYRLRIG
jgi:hypothetical protein